ncbi:MAG: DUF192 domain-containing protein [Pseudomonadota bacterium]
MKIAVLSLLALMAGHAFAQETEIVVVQSGDAAHEFVVELADEPDEITTGFMFRETLEPDAGMLFDFGTPREANMWMRNVTLPLDMLFIGEDGIVVAIARNAVPGSERRINPGVPVKGVLELNGGRAAELGIEPGATVDHPIFATSDDE